MIARVLMSVLVPGVSMLRSWAQLAALLGVSALAACGGSPSSPSGGGGTPTVSSVAVTLTSPLKVGQTSQATATATLSNGATQAVTSGWQSDAAGVATVSAAGLVTAIANGTATISISSDGRQGQQALRVVPDYDGSWSGIYLVTSCTETGYFATERFCAGTLNSSPPVRFALTQSGTTVNASFLLGQLTFPAVSATIGTDGGLPVESTLAENVRIVATWVLASGASGLTGAALTGTVRQRWTAAGQSGEGVLDGRIVTVTRTAPPVAAASLANRPRTLAEQRRQILIR
jgi:hypothetical protein